MLGYLIRMTDDRNTKKIFKEKLMGRAREKWLGEADLRQNQITNYRPGVGRSDGAS